MRISYPVTGNKVEIVFFGKEMGEVKVEWLSIDFLNSDWRDWRGSGRRENRLEKAEWLEQFLQQWGLSAPLPIDRKISTELLNLRECMRRITESFVRSETVVPEDLAALNQALSLALAHPRLVVDGEGSYHMEQVSPISGWDQVISQIARSFAELLVHEEARRIKICDNHDCQWVFFDESRNRVRRWCDDKMCGNLMKVRRFRERQKEKG
ncbi:CGNR zinc finger domain-containing protein [Brevibacillus choshinensis]|uniref:CGNR zinc finger domain-containing protein n=1 Tax=Brevibacillus choshinensis TaxID=54911 RepID=UPI002E1AB671|nr:CGNR zinc finger domain-containing protein [Brevibacillus choshinensis]MED4782336.1 CGNR zinc finger domain-containing protein [Brevibacillus choshinensis]